jgi:hypothetical protein
MKPNNTSANPDRKGREMEKDVGERAVVASFRHKKSEAVMLDSVRAAVPFHPSESEQYLQRLFVLTQPIIVP